VKTPQRQAKEKPATNRVIPVLHIHWQLKF
jgi:hypothetical protein